MGFGFNINDAREAWLEGEADYQEFMRDFMTEWNAPDRELEQGVILKPLADLDPEDIELMTQRGMVQNGQTNGITQPLQNGKLPGEQ